MSKRHKSSDSEDEEVKEVTGRRQRKKSDRFGGFILDEAEVDDEIEDEEEWEDGAEDYGLVGNEVDEMRPSAREIDGRRRQQHIWE